MVNWAGLKLYFTKKLQFSIEFQWRYVRITECLVKWAKHPPPPSLWNQCSLCYCHEEFPLPFTQLCSTGYNSHNRYVKFPHPEGYIDLLLLKSSMKYAFGKAIIQTGTHTPQSRLFPTKSANNGHYAMNYSSIIAIQKVWLPIELATTVKSIKRLESVSGFAITRVTLTCCMKRLLN